MAAMPGMDMLHAGVHASPWSLQSLLPTFLMWLIMMTGMMLPSATPAILLYAALAAKRGTTAASIPATWVFASGYLFVWIGYSLAATLLQAALLEGRLLSHTLSSSSGWLTGLLLITAGTYQWLPIKHACLDKCRSPLHVFMFHWRNGILGAFRMGASHGWYCVGCCWALMLLLFAAGVMNLVWVAALAAFVLVEKLFSDGVWFGRWLGAALVGCGLLVIATP